MRKGKHLLCKEDGFALIMVLWVITMLGFTPRHLMNVFGG